MATNCYGRRLSELLQEQQEPFLVHSGGAMHCRSVAEACGRLRLRGLREEYRGGERERRGVSRVSNGNDARNVLCGAKAVRKALLRDLAGCFSCGGRDRFRRLPPRFGDCDGGEDRDGGRQLSPVSVLQLRSDEESTELSQSGDEEGPQDDSKPSTSASSPSSDHNTAGAGAASPPFTFYSRSGGIIRAVKGNSELQFQTEREEESVARTEHALVSAWEWIAAGISRIPKMVELDLSASAREWRRRVGAEESRRVGESIEAMIFEEVRWEAVRDMLCS